MVVGAGELTFLKRRFQWPWWGWHKRGSILDSDQMYCFPFHLAKQIQLEIWATDLQQHMRNLTDIVLDLRVILHQKPSLRSVRVDLWDRQYRPVPSPWQGDRIVEGAGPCPPQEKFRGRIFNEPFDGGYNPSHYGHDCSHYEVWEHVVPVSLRPLAPRFAYCQRRPRRDFGAIEAASKCWQSEYQPDSGNRKRSRDDGGGKERSRLHDETRTRSSD